MANRRFQRLQALEREVKVLHAKISTDGSGDVTATSGLGVASAVHSANAYTITLEDKYNELLHVNVISGVAASHVITSEDVSGAKTVVITASALQASTDIRVELHLKNTGVSK